MIGRVDKSAAVARADGVGMVLANVGPGSEVADFHSVPTVHVDAAAGHRLRHWIARHDRGTVRLVPLGARPHRTARRAVVERGRPRRPGAQARRGRHRHRRPGCGAARGTSAWDLASGTSAATAEVSGAAALLVARHPDWSPAVVRSVLATSARHLPGQAVVRAGAGRLVADPAVRPGLAYDVRPGDYRAWLDRRTWVGT